MKRLYFLAMILAASIMTCTFIACGGDDGDDGSSSTSGGSSSEGGTPTATFNIVGTWRAYYQSNDPSRGQVYDLVTFNANQTGYVIEEVGYGSDDALNFAWQLTGNVIKIVLEGNYTLTWTIQQIIDNNTVVISDGKRSYNVVRDGTQSDGGGNNGGNGNKDGNDGNDGDDTNSVNIGLDDYGTDTNLNK